jgi:hypothetical protein
VLNSKRNETLGSLITYFAGTVAHLPQVKLDKLIYIAQLYHYAKFGELLTRTRFFSLSYGPHAPVIRSAIAEQLDSKAIFYEESRTSSDPVYSNPCLIIKSRKPGNATLSSRCLETLEKVTVDWGDKPYERILDYTVRTMPYLSTFYRERIDWALIRPYRGLKVALPRTERIKLHHFVERPEDTIWQRHGFDEKNRVTINEMVEIYLALCGASPEKIPSPEYLGFDLEAALFALDKMNSEHDGHDKCSTRLEKAAELADLIFNSMSFRSYSARVALTAAMLYLRKSGHSFYMDALEEHWPSGNTYHSFMQWFGKFSTLSKVHK